MSLEPLGGAVDETWNTGSEIVTHPGEAATNAVNYWAGNNSPTAYVFGPLSVLGDIAINPDRAAYYLEKANPAQMAATGLAAGGTAGIAGLTVMATSACYGVAAPLEALHTCTFVATTGMTMTAAGAVVTYDEQIEKT